MNTLIVSERICSSELGHVELPFSTLSVAIMTNSGREEVSLRLFRLPIVEGCPFLEYLSRHLHDLLHRTSGSEQGHLRWVMQMFSFYCLGLEFDPRRKRAFNIGTLDRSETCRELAERTRTTTLPAPERLIRFADQPSTPTAQLIHEAVYVRRDLRVPLGCLDYGRFREWFISELITAKSTVDRIVEEGAETSKFRKAWRKCSRDLFRKATGQEKKISDRFADLVDKQPSINYFQE